MNYKKIMGYDKKKKVIKENKVPKKNTVLDGIKKELNDYKQQQIDALEKIQQYVYAITNDYDSELSSKIEELQRNR